jgi:hypothetical protein
MSRARRKLRIYLLILLVAVLVALVIPYVTQTVSDYFQDGPKYYYPHDLERDHELGGKQKG